MALPKLPKFVCVSEEAYVNTFRKKQEYLSEKFEKTNKDVINLNAILKTNIDMDAFAKWWTIVLDYGNNPFELDLLVMGAKRKVAVKLDNDFTATIISSSKNDATWRVEMLLNILYLVEDV